MIQKQSLRRKMRSLRRDHVAAMADDMRALLFRRPPGAIVDAIAPEAVVGLYHALPDEAPTLSYARFFAERGNPIALPRIDAEDAAMQFAAFDDPFAQSDLEAGPHGIMQPAAGAAALTPTVVFVPVLAVTHRGERLGQGGGYYDRWLAAHPEARAIGLAWDCQLIDDLPTEPHDRSLTMIITPTRAIGERV